MRKLPTLQALARLVRFANAYSVQLLSLLLTQGCSNPWARIRKRLRRSTQDNTFSTRALYSTQGNTFQRGQYILNAGQYISTQDNTFSTQGNTFSTQGNAFRPRLPTCVLSAKLKQGVEDALLDGDFSARTYEILEPDARSEEHTSELQSH